MDRVDVASMANDLLSQHGLHDWAIQFDHARRRAGQTNYRYRIIQLSGPLMDLYSVEEVRETILHEIAHALVGPDHGHDAVWRAKAKEIGSTGERTVSSCAPRILGRWVGVCPQGHYVDRMRRPATPVSCYQCSRRFDLRYLLTWTFDGKPLNPEEISPSYATVWQKLHHAP
ncbi:SprT-like domain-containing protein [Actinomyces vulturis]|uniref:SprT-like domain-containing protein n=1 Tax=Actinomyces vulturis TaxID=1857645 RepID=UPI00083130ED|nr:SprT-like domain-containing protein [Actinomyces vulturis]